MNRTVILLSRAVRAAPVRVLVIALVLTAAIGSFAGQVVEGGGNEGFSPNNPELLAQQRVAEVFGSSGDVVMQVLLRGQDGGDVISPAGVQTVLRLQEVLQEGAARDALVDRPEQPPLVTPLGPVLQGAAAEGVDPSALDAAAVDARFAAAIEQLPPAEAGFVTGLLPGDVDAADAQSDLALAVVFLDPDQLPEDEFEQGEALGVIADEITAIDVPGIELEPFAFSLLFAGTDSFTAEIARLFGMALLIILVILGFVYFTVPAADGRWVTSIRRTVADVALTLLVVIMAITWVQGTAGLLGPEVLGWIDALAEPARILPVLLIGLGVDFGIHLTARYREEVGTHPVADSIGTATRTVGVALVLATATTAVGFLTNLTAPVPALRDFGILAAIGIVAAFLLMLTVFPAARLLLDRRAEAAGHLPRQTLSGTGDRMLPRVMEKLAILAERAAIPTLIVTVGIGGVLGGIGLANVSTEFSFTDFLPEDDPLIQTFDTLDTRFNGGVGEVTTVVVEGPLTAQTHNSMVAANQALPGLDGVVLFGDDAAGSSPVSVLGQVLQSLAPPPPAGEAPAAEAPDGGDPAMPPGPPVDPALAQQIAGLLDAGALTVPDSTDVEALYGLLLQAAPGVASQVIAFPDDLPDGEGTVRFLLQTDAGEREADQLADALADAFAPVRSAVGEDATVVATSSAIVSTRITDSLRDSQLRSLFIAVLAAMILLVISFWITDRRPVLGAITIAPVALIVLWTFGMMAATGVPVGPVTATIAALAVGIGVPYTIHVSNRWSEDRAVMATPEEAIRSTVRHTGGALAGSAVTTMAGFGILVTSSLTPFQQFGLVTVYSIGFAMLAATVVLPSMLVLYDRALRRRGDDPAAAAAPPPSGRPTSEGPPPVSADGRLVTDDGTWAPPSSSAV